MSLAMLRIGAVAVPLDPASKGPSRDELAKQIGIGLIVGVSSSETSNVKFLAAPQFRDIVSAQTSPSVLQRPASDALAVLFHGSGTTGRPKIIPLKHRHLIARCLNNFDELKPAAGDRVIVLQQFRSQTYMTRSLQCLFFGGCLVENMALRTRSPDYSRILLDTVERHGVAHINCTAFHAHMIVNGIKDGSVCRCPGLKCFTVGGSTVSPELRRSIVNKISPNLCINYGANETGPIARASPGLLLRHPDTVGAIAPRTEVAIFGEDDHPLAPNTPGAIRVRGDSVVDRYYDDAAATKAAFRNGWFDTGDIGYLTADGALFLLGRNDDMMILNGFNIHPAEIEQVLESHPCVSEAAAVGAKSDVHGDIPMAFAVLGRTCTEAELMSHCSERLGVMAPRRIFIVESLPRNASGKVLRRELAQRIRSRPAS
jgi:long-chain acyl-CoA synthetase